MNKPRVAPHEILFVLYNLAYFFPLFAAFLWGYSEGGTEGIIGMGASTMLKITAIYLMGISAFMFGSKCRSFLNWSLRGPARHEWRPIWFRVSLSEKVILGITLIVFVISKVALIPTGVYQQYAFDANLMDSAIWNFSTFCSETLILLAVLVLFSKLRHNVACFVLISAVNGINILHGTRIFLISSIMAAIVYAYIRGYLPVKRVLLYGPPIFLGVLVITYLVYLSRSDSSLSGAFSLAKILSPIMYESMFSQLSLIGTVQDPSVWDLTGHVPRFLEDIILFIIPRIIVPDKDSLLYLRQFDYLSPKGAFNGYAIGLIYLGIFLPAFYFFLGFIGDWLYHLSRKSAWWFVLYMFYASDFLLHIMRDGYLIPIKMLVNTVQWIVILMVCRKSLQLLGAARDYAH